ncbi:hypothetical protein EVAR_34294_1 [Eumeta japonica]|uniref:Uncharacterized protein n=1 Tax=Eumeta variegata TaxID=151549 RepID=A0A4C1VW32_EUMVA|nr:hypothetical protein EVAR_34294_1 [Eumeta japonica]
MEYIRPNLVAKVTKELLCSYRNPMDVAYALNECLTSEGTVIVRTTMKLKLHDSIPHGVVYCVYYADNGEDEVGRFIKRALAASDKIIKDNNIKMTILNRDKMVMEVLEVKRCGSFG